MPKVVFIDKRVTCSLALTMIIVSSAVLFTSSPAGITAEEKYPWSANIDGHSATNEEIAAIMQMVGVYDPEVDYNAIIDGHGTGLVPPTVEQWSELVGTLYVVEDISLEADGPTPTEIDLSSDQYFPPIGNQGSEGSCVAWATGYYAKTYQEAMDQGWDLSGASWVGGFSGAPSVAYQDMIFSPDFIYHQINNGNDGGSAYADAMALVSNIGVSTWSTMPYSMFDHTSWPSEAAWREAPLYRGEGGYNMHQFGSSVDALKNLLLSGNLAIISINGYLYTYLTDNEVWTTDNYNPQFTNHANTVVGFDDNITYTENGAVRHGAFKVANSWGTGWAGDNNGDGFYYISYEAMRTKVGYFMYFLDIADYNPKAIAVFEMDHDERYECDITFGVGDPSSPSDYKEFAPYFYGGGAHPFPSNPIVVDITEFYPFADDSLFMEVYDYNSQFYGSDLTGTLVSFHVEEYATEYRTDGSADHVMVSLDTPLQTANSSSIFATCLYSPGLSAPLLSFPSDSNAMGDISPTFSWTEVQNASGYSIEVATDPTTDENGDFLVENIVYQSSVACPSGNTFIRPDHSFELTTYYWHVRGVDGGSDPGPWSDTWSMEIVSGITYIYNPGWTLSSFPYNPTATDLDTLLSGLEGTIDYVYRWDPVTEKYEYSHYIEELGWQGNFSDVDDSNGFWFHSVSDQPTLLFEAEGACTLGSIEVYVGWNLLSWPNIGVATIGDALGELSQYVDYVYRWNPYLDKYEYSHYIEELGWQGNFTTFEPGYGYWLHSTGDFTWEFQR